MSIIDRKIEITAKTLARHLFESEAVSGIAEEKLAAVILRVLRDDRDAELAIDDAAKALMKTHAAEISRGNMDSGLLFRKFKAQIAKEKGFTL